MAERGREFEGGGHLNPKGSEPVDLCNVLQGTDNINSVKKIESADASRDKSGRDNVGFIQSADLGIISSRL